MYRYEEEEVLKTLEILGLEDNYWSLIKDAYRSRNPIKIAQVKELVWMLHCLFSTNDFNALKEELQALHTRRAECY